MPAPSIQDLEKAREAFLENEPRDLFYRVATELIQLSIEGKTQITLPEALAVLLQTWNRSYYRFKPFNNQHYTNICNLIKHLSSSVFRFRDRSILSLAKDDLSNVVEIFDEFEKVLGPVGASKSLHLLAPEFFPLWDRAIARAYKVALGLAGTNSGKYLKFMLSIRHQCMQLQELPLQGENLLKRIDEYNYCHFTNKWI
jgi:hypothetical protein